MSAYITLPYPPSVNHMYNRGHRQVYKNPEAQAWQHHSTLILRGHDAPPLTCDVKVIIWLYRPRKSGDIDNRIKPVLDVLEGVVFANDRQVTELHVYRRDDKVNPRVEVSVVPLTANA